MDIEQLGRQWNEASKRDPLWAILTRPGKAGNKWVIEEFLQTGVAEVEAIFDHVESLALNIGREKALDFGCGVGRLTQALANRVDEVFGIDIAPAMLELARSMNSHGDRCKYLLNETNDLQLFPDNYFDFVYTNITLQHMEPRFSKRYLIEFMRVLMPNGLLIFQLPSEPTPGVRADSAGGTTPAGPWTEMYGIMPEEVLALLETNGAKVVEAIKDQTPTAPHDWHSFRYYAIKERLPSSDVIRS